MRPSPLLKPFGLNAFFLDQASLQRFGVFLALLLSLPSTAGAWQSAPEKSEVEKSVVNYVLQGVTIHTMDGRQPFVGSVSVLSDGTIGAVAEKIEVPESATVIPLEGFQLVPGWIESRGKIWLTDAARIEANTKAGLDIVDAIDPWSDDWQECAANGITAVGLQPSSTSFLGGYGAVARVGDYTQLDQIVLAGQSSVQAAVGISGATSRDRFVQLESLDKLLAKAKSQLDKDSKVTEEKEDPGKAETSESTDEESDSESGDEEKDESSDASEAADSGDEKADLDTATAALLRVLKREIPLHIEVRHSDSLKGVLELAKKYDFRLVLDRVTEGKRLAGELASLGVPVCVGGASADDDFQWLKDYAESGAMWSLSSFPSTGRGASGLRQQVAWAIRQGVKPEIALSAVTIYPARMLGVAEKLGSISPGKQADLVVFAGNPVDASSPIRLVMSGGKIQFANQAIEATEVGRLKLAAQATSEEIEKLTQSLSAGPDREFGLRCQYLWQDGKWDAALLHISEGKIVSVSPEDPATKPTESYPVYDLGNLVVTPGLVNGRSHLGQSDSLTDAIQPDTSYLRASDFWDPGSETSREMMRSGFLHIALAPGNSNPVSGSLSQLRMGVGGSVIHSSLAGQFVINSDSRSRERFPASLNGQLQVVRTFLDGQKIDSNVYVEPAIMEGWNAERLRVAEALSKGQLPVIVLADEDVELRKATELAQKYGLRMIVLSKGRVTDHLQALKQQNAALLVPVLSADVYQPMLQQWVEAAQAGVPLVFAGDSAVEIRATAAKLVAAGLPASTALDSLTCGGAKTMGMELCGVAAGNEANLVIWNGSPLDPATEVVGVMVGGQLVPEK